MLVVWVRRWDQGPVTVAVLVPFLPPPPPPPTPLLNPLQRVSGQTSTSVTTARARAHMCVCMCARARVYVCVPLCVCVFECVYVRAHTLIAREACKVHIRDKSTQLNVLPHTKKSQLQLAMPLIHNILTPDQPVL